MAQWSAQDAYTIKVVGSSPTLKTNKNKCMRIEISEYYKRKGFNAVYVAVNKEPRRVATLRRKDGTLTSMSYAKYLYTSHYQCEIQKGLQVDHINNDKMDDRVENLQVLSQYENTLKSCRRKTIVQLCCPICGKRFQYLKRNLSTHPIPCCSRRCGGIKSHMTLREKLKPGKAHDTLEG